MSALIFILFLLACVVFAFLLAPAVTRTSLVSSGVLLLALVAASLALYYMLGSPQIIPLAQERQRLLAEADALKQAVLQSQGDPRWILLYAKALIAAEGGVVSAEAKKSLDMVLTLEPENKEALHWRGLWRDPTH